jgi:hypothetical protein
LSFCFVLLFCFVLFCISFIFVALFVPLPLVQAAKSELNIEDYSVNQTSLEQIFLRIAATKDDETSEAKDDASSGGVLVQPQSEVRSHGSGARVEASDATAAAPAIDTPVAAGSHAVAYGAASEPEGTVVQITQLTSV